MIDQKTYSARRDALRTMLGPKDAILLSGHKHQPRNYRANTYPFRQSSHVLYFSGLALSDIYLWIGATPADDRLFGPPDDLENVVWHGPHPTLADLAAGAGIATTSDSANLSGHLAAVEKTGGRLHYLLPYHADTLDFLTDLLGRPHAVVKEGVSRDLMRRIAGLRSYKSADEIAEIENALFVAREMHVEAMRAVKSSKRESDIRAIIEKTALAHDRPQAYNPIVTIHGEVLHNNDYSHALEAGRLLLNDSGAESPLGYASDITRTFPVSGKFTAPQKDVYETVLRAQIAAIDAVKPGVPYRDIHMLASRTIVDGLKAIGLMKGSTDDAVAAGAHALFFPHGLGHMLGLDVHDMEDIGEDIVGYAEKYERSKQFGTAYLRLARPLEKGFVFKIGRAHV